MLVLGPHDLHMVFADADDSLQVYDHTGAKTFACEARNAATGGEGLGHDAECPPGQFLLGTPVAKATPPFGPYFIPILEQAGHHEFDQYHRAGIGLHGGGSGLADPFAPRQGWVMTHGCIRTQNEDLLAVVKYVHDAHAAGGAVYITVVRD